MLKRTSRVAAIAAAGVLAMAGPAMAHDDYVEDGAYDNAKSTHGHEHGQHGGAEGHIDVENYGAELVSKLQLSRVTAGKIADVAVHGDYAYLAAWGGETCKDNGVHVVDISDVHNPVEVAFVPSKEGSYPGEGVQVTRIATPSFTGEVLVTNNEICKGQAGFGGINIYDVRNPARPTPLAVGFGDDSGNNEKKTAHQTHSVFAWADGAEAYAVMVDNQEAADVDIVDITNPKKPSIIAEYDLAALSKAQGKDITQPGLDEVFLHDMVVKEIDGQQIMLASYWDGGYVQLDVSDPRAATVISDSDFAVVDPEVPGGVRPEGNAHQAEYTLDDQYVIAADEDFSPFALVGRNDTDGTDVTASQGSDTRKLGETETITGSTVFGGRACNGDADVPTGSPSTVDIAVVERGLCTFTEKVANVEAAGGYDAVFVFNRTGSDACNASLGMSVSGSIPAFGVAPREQGYAMFGKEGDYDNATCLAGDGTQLAPIALGAAGDTLTFKSYFDGWGYVHLFDRETMTDLDTYAIPEAHDIDFADGHGDMSVHEVATSKQAANLAYLSYYAGGLRIVQIQDDNLVEVGAFIDEGGNNFWGVEAFEQGGQEYIALSDRDFGLYIMKYAP